MQRKSIENKRMYSLESETAANNLLPFQFQPTRHALLIRTPMAYITKPRVELGTKPAPVMAEFSSRGPNPVDASILKPDIAAPGVNILAAIGYGVSPSFTDDDKRRIPLGLMSGTSMACPHVSGVVALLKTLYPKWSPAAIKSAIMTTAKTRDNNRHSILNLRMLKETPFAYGSGNLNPEGAMNPGLVYDTTMDDYLNLLCARGYNQTLIKLFSPKPFACAKTFKLTDFNYPSISVTNVTLAPVTINRKLKNVGTPATYIARVKTPLGVSISVDPSTLQFTAVDEEKAFKVVVKSTGQAKLNGYVFGTLVWSDGKHFVRSPIAVNLGR